MAPRAALLVGSLFVLTVSAAGAASATTWQNGDVITFSQDSWGDAPTPTNAAGLLVANHDNVYSSTFGVLEVGEPGAAGFSIRFLNSLAVLTYLPAAGAPSALAQDYINPSLTSAGVAGGNVTALQLNVDFSDARVTLGASGIPFGDLILSDFSSTLVAEGEFLNGMTVRQYLGLVNGLLGGGFSFFGPLDPVTFDLNLSFADGSPTQFAQDHLVAPPSAAVPEVSSLLLLGVGAMGVGWSRRLMRRR